MNEINNLKSGYSLFYEKSDLNKTFPNEYLIRIFLGNYPRLKLDRNFKNKNILDLGMGDGRNLKFFCSLGFDGYGVEITKSIIDKVDNEFSYTQYKPKLKVGNSKKIPFEDNFFDYLVSWNSSYYMGYEDNFNLIESHFHEISRVIKKGGYLVISVPQSTDSVFNYSEEIKPGYRKITKDYYEIRTDFIMASFEDQKYLENLLSPFFYNFAHGDVTDDCFGLNKHSFLIVCKKK
tara:strand:+ start:1825 stop:2526 length:702 start_codon:yes stop_codon:yes gene_type:complete